MNAVVLVLYSSIVARSCDTEKGDEDVAPTMGLSLSGSSHPAFEASFVVISQPCMFV